MLVGSLAISWLIEHYCDLFYEFGNFAKNRATAHPWLMISSTILLFWVSAIICKNYAPNASGCNVDFGLELSQKLTCPKNQQITIATNSLNLKAALAIAASSLLATYAGGSLGREGTSIQIATILLICVAHFFKSKLGDISLESLIYGGYALGFAIAFNAPLVAIIYVVEKMQKKIFTGKNRRKLLSTIAAVAFVAIILHFYFDRKSVYFSGKIDLDLTKNFWILIAISLFCGMLGAIFKRICQFALNQTSKFSSRNWHLVPIICGTGTGLIAVFSGVYSFGGGIKTVNDALSSNYAILGFSDVFGRLASTFFTFVAGCAGGMVAPAIAIGAGIGSAVSKLSGEMSNLACIITGMVAFLSPILGAPLSSALVIITAAKQDLSMLPFMILISAIASASYRFTEQQIISLKIK